MSAILIISCERDIKLAYIFEAIAYDRIRKITRTPICLEYVDIHIIAASCYLKARRVSALPETQHNRNCCAVCHWQWIAHGESVSRLFQQQRSINHLTNGLSNVQSKTSAHLRNNYPKNTDIYIKLNHLRKSFIVEVNLSNYNFLMNIWRNRILSVWMVATEKSVISHVNWLKRPRISKSQCTFDVDVESEEISE